MIGDTERTDCHHPKCEMHCFVLLTQMKPVIIKTGIAKLCLQFVDEQFVDEQYKILNEFEHSIHRRILTLQV